MSSKLYQRVISRASAHTPRNINIVHKLEIHAAGFNTRLAVRITKAFGSMPAFYVLVTWMLGWILLASGGISLFAHDPYPFTFLLFLSNLVQLWALPILAVGQQVLGRHGELLAEEQYQTTQKNYHDTEEIMKHLDAQDVKILDIEQKILEILQREEKTA